MFNKTGILEVKGSNNCYLCNNLIRWQKVTTKNVTTGFYEVTGNDPELVLTNKENDEITYEAIVKCPICHLKNKFIGKQKL
ncbi:MAG: hypothetical protein SOV85_13720 [Clostridium sp.]|uniref:hypothetical protein n=1 Tax=Clostridium sp. TaxID=1506 RepID=UPI002A750192|nr:hypothetical protein [Clostridium sp.]MDY2632390.1 hypothetical protein [Clostridium sp.]